MGTDLESVLRRYPELRTASREERVVFLAKEIERLTRFAAEAPKPPAPTSDPHAIEFTPSQRALMKALVASGGYGTEGEIVRAALDHFILQGVPKARLLGAAIWAYDSKVASLSRAAEMANISHEEMHKILVREGIFDAGGGPETLDDEVAFLGKHSRKAATKPGTKRAP